MLQQEAVGHPRLPQKGACALTVLFPVNAQAPFSLLKKNNLL